MDQTSITIECSDLILEVTRRCNMQCEHCIRGDAQNLDIGDDILELVAKYIQPYSVTFSGGEPSLNIPSIRRYFELAERYGHLPSSFFVVTNGKVNQLELAVELLKAYSKMDEPELCGVHISEDAFHDTVDKEHSILTGLSFYDKNGHTNLQSKGNSLWVINAGRAAEYGWGTRYPNEIAESLEDCIEDITTVDGEARIYMPDMLYVGANGLVADQCDISYEQLDDGALCHISQLPKELMKIVRQRSSVPA